MSDNTVFRVGDLDQNQPTRFDLKSDAPTMAQLAMDLGLAGLRKLRFHGQIAPSGQSDWRLTGRLGATVVQPCVVTLEPVTTRIDTDVQRLFAADFEHPDAPEAEMPEDDTVEPLGTHIDTAAVMVESLSLNLPQYPRVPDAELGEAVFTKPGQTPMRDEDARPFAGLAALRDSLGEEGEEH